MRYWIKLVEASLDEKYTSDNSALLRYMKASEFDPYGLWHAVAEWLSQNGDEEDFQALAGVDHMDEDEIAELDPEVFHRLSSARQAEIARDVVDTLVQYDPASAPTWAHMSLSKDRLLPRTTWLIHFSDEAESIAQNGFKYGIDQMDRLGLTTWLGKSEKGYGGYNFAFEATSRDALRGTKYGRDAVLFMNSGVKAYHYGDDESQIIFIGKDVDPRDIVLLRNDGGDWLVTPKADIGRDAVFRGTLPQAIKWVMSNWAQYRRILGGR